MTPKKKVISKLEEFKNSDPVFFKELINVSLKNIEKIKKELFGHLHQRNIKAVKQSTHALKGVALNLDFKDLAELCASVEPFKDLDNAKKFESI
jgi:HPt (histidine-containing phosphotransfer) domain-containing protein